MMTSPHKIGALCALAITLVGCAQETPNLLRAKRAESRFELVGGPVAYADVGDFILENDKLRAAILDPQRSWGPGLFGGSLVDLDVRRKDGRFPEGKGRDRFAEVFPLANLLTPAPLDTQVSVHNDGSDGKEATIRVEGSGYAMLHSLYVIRDNKKLLEDVLQLKDIKANVRFVTDYTVRPGESFVRMKTRIILTDKVDETATCTKAKKCADGLECVYPDDGEPIGTCRCPDIKSTCDLSCEVLQRDAAGCDVCACSDTIQMNMLKGDEGVISGIMGDSFIISQSNEKSGGMGGGDFVFFGKHNKQFVPGNGFDQQQAVWEAWFEGRDTFANPFFFDYVAAVGGDVSYAYYTVKNKPEDPDPLVAVPVFTSTATPFISSMKQCLQDESDDAECDAHRVLEYERFIAVGEGDAASVVNEIWRHRGVPTGEVTGFVRWLDSGAAATNAHVFAMHDPEPGRKWANIDELVAANRVAMGSPGVVLSIDADVGMDPVEDGDFTARLPAGDYQIIAKDASGIVLSELIPLKVVADKRHVVLPTLPTPARLQINVTNEAGDRIPAKETVVALNNSGEPRAGRAPSRLPRPRPPGTASKRWRSPRTVSSTSSPGRYRLVVSHGIEYSVTRSGLPLSAGQQRTESAQLTTRSTPRAGSPAIFTSTKTSFDSGMVLDHRVRTIVAEGVDYVAATDHDVVTDLMPYVRQLKLDAWLKAVVGVEVSTLDIGHYIGFPFKYQELDVPSHGSVDWYCMASDKLVDTMVFDRSGFHQATIDPPLSSRTRGMAFKADAIGLNPFTLSRNRNANESERELDVVFRTVTCTMTPWRSSTAAL